MAEGDGGGEARWGAQGDPTPPSWGREVVVRVDFLKEELECMGQVGLSQERRGRGWRQREYSHMKTDASSALCLRSSSLFISAVIMLLKIFQSHQ